MAAAFLCSACAGQQAYADPFSGGNTPGSALPAGDVLEEPARGQGMIGTITEVKTYDWSAADIYEAEDAALLGNARILDDHVEGLENDGDGLAFDVTVKETGFYDLAFVTRELGGYKENYVTVDGERLGTVVTESESYADSIFHRVRMEAGSHRIEITKFWGWICIDSLKVKPADDIDPEIYRIPYTLINENADENAKRLYSYMVDQYGNHIISGQYCDTGMIGAESTAVQKVAGDYPAILGLDLIDYTPSRVANGTVGNATDLAIDYWNKGGIVTICWHWNAPEKYLTGTWYMGFYREHTNIDLAKIMNGQDPEGYELLMRDIDAIAQELGKMRDAGVPVLWRPLHEAAGGWFWWGAAGPEAYRSLYHLLYDKLTNEYGLNNLIWIWNGQDPDWYPGDEVVDIIGEDCYPGEHIYTPQTDTFLRATAYTDAPKMIVMSENGCLFDPELAERDGAWWGFFCTWQREFVRKGEVGTLYSEQYTEKYMVEKVYGDERVITRSELPDLTTYPVGGE